MIHLFDAWSEIIGTLRDSERLLLMLDFDGTLAPIVAQPPEARVPPQTQTALQALQSCPNVTLAIVSGRSVREVQALAGLTDVHYFGSHGGERLRPGCDTVGADTQAREEIRSVCCRLALQLADVPGFAVEDKGASAAAHYRNVEPSHRWRVEKAVRDAQTASPSLRISAGKMVFDITPLGGKDKGAAVAELLREVGGFPLYFGDDTTDESAFRALPESAVTVHVGPSEDQSAARFRVADPGEVAESLLRILEIARGASGASRASA